MSYYEMLYIVNSNFERKKIDDTMREVEDRLSKTKSNIINHLIWGKKKLAYPIQGHSYGTYVMLHYSGGDRNALDEFNSWLKLSDLIIRHMIIRLENEPDKIEKTDNELNIEPEKDKDSIKKENKINDDEEETIEKIEGVK